MAKGSSYERELCGLFSLWWSGGKRDDIFWRAAGSGNRAKVRGRAGRGTHGQHGDICATDPTGTPLIDMFTIEIKRGYSANTIQDLLDKSDNAAAQVWDQFFDQVMESYEQAGSFAWLVVNRRDRREAMVWFPRHAANALRKHGAFAYGKPLPYASIDVGVRRGKRVEDTEICGMRLKDFLEAVQPEHVRGMAKEM